MHILVEFVFSDCYFDLILNAVIMKLHEEVIFDLTGCFFPGTPVSSSINKTDFHDITEILLKVALSTLSLTLTC